MKYTLIPPVYRNTEVFNSFYIRKRDIKMSIQLTHAQKTNLRRSAAL